MTDREYHWLSELSQDINIQIPKDVLAKFKSLKLVKTFWDGSVSELTDRGLTMLLSEQQIREHNAKDTAQKEEDQARAAKQRRKDSRHDYFVGIISGIAGSIVTLVIEHFSVIRNFIEQLFKPYLC